jgi:hypothetical protein
MPTKGHRFELLTQGIHSVVFASGTGALPVPLWKELLVREANFRGFCSENLQKSSLKAEFVLKAELPNRR